MQQRFHVCVLTCILFSISGWGQLPPIGQWREHLNWSACEQVCGNNAMVWCSTSGGILKVESEDNSILRLSKVNGLSSSGIKDIAWDSATSSLTVAYSNTLIDIIRNEKTFRISTVQQAAPNENILFKSVFCRNGKAYIASTVGIMVIDLYKKEISETYKIGNEGDTTTVYAVALNENYFFAATQEGLKRCSAKAVNPSDYRNWQLLSGKAGLPEGPVRQLLLLGDQLYAVQQKTLFHFTGTEWLPVYSDEWEWVGLKTSGSDILICQTSGTRGRIALWNGSSRMIIEDPVYTRSPSSVIRQGDDYWIADKVNGFSRYNSGLFTSYRPKAPEPGSVGPFAFSGQALWMVTRDIRENRQPVSSPAVLLRFQDGEWKSFPTGTDPVWSKAGAFNAITFSPIKNALWLGSLGKGLFSFESNAALVDKNTNSPLSAPPGSTQPYWVSGLALDRTNNLWISNSGAFSPLHVLKADGTWRSFRPTFLVKDNAVGTLLIDDSGQKWIVLENEQGLACFNDANTPDNPGDDQWKWYKSGSGSGNLPSNNVKCLAKDKNNFIWVGTSKGIGIIQCPGSVFASAGCEAVLPVVKQGSFTGYLFNDEVVQCITVDGADRKWIGTKKGAWLISADGEQTILHFDTDNSPLPDNDIRQIGIDPSTGEVFFASPGGITSLRGTATEGQEAFSGIKIFPNPIPPGFNGTIAIKGLKADSRVKITELNGRLVFETTSLGGQAVWNGRNYKGQAVAPGIYLVLAADKNGNDKTIDKMVFIGQ